MSGSVGRERLHISADDGRSARICRLYSRSYILGDGYIWVGVSAQQVGISALVAFSPTRYAGFDASVGGTIRVMRFPMISSRRRNRPSGIRPASIRSAD
jgi:hypothetical protein